jgi:hypothetical protein
MRAWPGYGTRVPLWDAVYKQDAPLVQKILMSVVGPSQVNTAHGVRKPFLRRSALALMVEQLQMQTSVHLAVRKGNAKVLKALLFTDADPNARTVRVVVRDLLYQ